MKKIDQTELESRLIQSWLLDVDGLGWMDSSLLHKMAKAAISALEDMGAISVENSDQSDRGVG